MNCDRTTMGRRAPAGLTFARTLLVLAGLSVALSGPAAHADNPPVKLVGWWMGDNGYDVVVSESHAYMVSDGLRIFDVSIPAWPRQVARYSPPSPPDAFMDSIQRVAVSGNLACVLWSWCPEPGDDYVFHWRYLLSVVDVTNPAAPQTKGTLALTDAGSDVTIAGGYAYVANGAAGLQVVDLSNVTSPGIVGHLSTTGAAVRIAIAGGFAFITEATSGVEVINIANPLAPGHVAQYATLRSAYDLAIDGNYAYVVTRDGGFEVIDVSHPEAPAYAGFCETTGDAYAVTVLGHYAYTAGGGDTCTEVIDVANPAQPVRIGSFPRRGISFGVAASGRHVYTVQTDAGLIVLLPGPESAWVDLDADGDVDLRDFIHFQACFNGPNQSWVPSRNDCLAADFDGDFDVDLNDFQVFQACFNGPNQPPRCG